MKKQKEPTWIDRIRKAIQMNIGGYESASDDNIIAAWDQLDLDTRELYLESTHADSD